MIFDWKKKVRETIQGMSDEEKELYDEERERQHVKILDEKKRKRLKEIKSKARRDEKNKKSLWERL